MIRVLQALFILILYLGVAAFSHESCRHCKGIHMLKFKSAITQSQAAIFVKNTLEPCATGHQWKITGFRPFQCTGGYCFGWNVDVEAFRYCGNGGVVSLNVGPTCAAGTCATSSLLNLLCFKSVKCAGTCKCADCGC